MNRPDHAAIETLASRIRGEVLQPAHDRFADACRLWNGMIQRTPAAIVRPASSDDVVASLRVARTQGLPVSVRGGGHNVAGNALCDGGLVIDLSGMKSVLVDEVRRVARVGGGATLADVDRATQLHGLATPLGAVPRTGVGGLTLHGGLGFLTRKHGLSCDNLIRAEVVTADGRVLTASADENSDLLWALRGGGGNFGVVTSMDFQLHPVGPDVWVFLVFYPMADAAAVMKFFRETMPAVANDVMGIAIFWNSPHDESLPPEARNVPVVVLAGVYSGPMEQGEQAVAPFRQIATPLIDMSGPMPFLTAQGLFDPEYPDGRRYYWKSLFLDSLDDRAVETLAAAAADRPSLLSSVDIWALGGAMRDEPAGGSAFARRDAPFLLGIEANWTDAAADDANVSWARRLFRQMQPFSRGGIYLNFPGFNDDVSPELRASYGGSFERLGAIKAKYDPDNLFRSNFNIAPAATA
jgi:FAD/FMN-containing dehydrogenase